VSDQNLTRVTSTLYEDQFPFMITSRWIFLRTFQTKLVQKIKTLLLISPSSCLLRPFSSQAFFSLWIPLHFLNIVILHLSAYEDGTECSETSAYKIQTPGELPRRKHTTIKTLTSIFKKKVFFFQKTVTFVI